MDINEAKVGLRVAYVPHNGNPLSETLKHSYVRNGIEFGTIVKISGEVVYVVYDKHLYPRAEETPVHRLFSLEPIN